MLILVRKLAFFVLFFLFFPMNLLKAQTICLNMIVKDEEPVIQRCLESVKPLIDYWVIVDTGSRDSTREIIYKTLKDIPGELHERVWHNFEVNRNEALDLAKGKGDFLLFIDADEVFVYDERFELPKLDKDSYHFVIKNVVNERVFSEYLRTLLINNHLNWKWEGVIHEVICCPEAKTNAVMEGIVNHSKTQEGARAQDPQKYLKDAQILEKALEKEPNNKRYIYYLAASYMNAGQWQRAIDNFQKRIALEPNVIGSGEIFNSLYFTACLQITLEMESKKVIDGLSKAYLYDSSRAEPLYQLGSYLIDQESFLLADLVLRKALSIPKPKEIYGAHYLLGWVYDWGILHKFAECSFKMGQLQESEKALEKLITQPLPEDLLEPMQNNLKRIKEVMNALGENLEGIPSH